MSLPPALFTSVHGNDLHPCVVRAGLDPDNLPLSDPSKMDFSQATGIKAWKQIWGSGQGIGVVKDARPVAEYVGRLRQEYRQARRELQGKASASIARRNRSMPASLTPIAVSELSISSK